MVEKYVISITGVQFSCSCSQGKLKRTSLVLKSKQTFLTACSLL